MPTVVPLIDVELDRPRHLLFDRRAVKGIELELTRIWGKDYTFFEGVRRLSEMLLDNDLSKLSYVNISVFLYYGCLHEDSSLTLPQVEEALPYADPVGLIPYASLILQAWQAASPPPPPHANDREVAESDPLGGSTGSGNGPSSGSTLALATPSSGA
jgi:hypothetical protein